MASSHRSSVPSAFPTAIQAISIQKPNGSLPNTKTKRCRQDAAADACAILSALSKCVLQTQRDAVAVGLELIEIDRTRCSADGVHSHFSVCDVIPPKPITQIDGESGCHHIARAHIHISPN